MKKILLITVIVFCIFQMVVMATAIDIGSAASDRVTYHGHGKTVINKGNPANADGKITNIKIWANGTMANCEVATFYVVSGTNFSTRDTEAIGTVTAGAQRSFGVDLDVEEGDFIGVYVDNGKIEAANSGGSGCWIVAGTDHIPCENVEFTLDDGGNDVISLYGTGETVEEEVEVSVIFFGGNF